MTHTLNLNPSVDLFARQRVNGLLHVRQLSSDLQRSSSTTLDVCFVFLLFFCFFSYSFSLYVITNLSLMLLPLCGESSYLRNGLFVTLVGMSCSCYSVFEWAILQSQSSISELLESG